MAKTDEHAAILAAAFDASPNPYMLVTPSLRYAAANQAYLDALGVEREALIGKPLFEVFDSGPGDDAPENVRLVQDSILRVLATDRKDHLALIPFAIPEPSPGGEVVYRQRYWSATHTPIHDAEGRIAYVLQHTTDVTELNDLRRTSETASAQVQTTSALDAIVGGNILNRARQVQEDNRKLEAERDRVVDLLMQASGFVALLSGPEHRFEFANEAYQRVVGRSDLIGRPVAEALPEVVEQGYVDLLDSVIATGEPVEGRGNRLLLRNAEGRLEDVYVDFVYQPIRNPEGRNVGVFVQGHDITDMMLAAQRQRLMIDELNHRVKNTLATVQSIAIQTARSTPEPKAFAQGFQARLLSLSHTHDLLTRSHWEGADLRDVLEHETAAHGANRVLLNGPAVALGPAMALSLGMILHELTTNAAKYGALSTGAGRVLVDWSLANQTERRLILSWREVGGPPVAQPERRGFGSRMIERNIRHDLAGEIEVSYAPDGFRAEIVVPLAKEPQS